MANIHDATFKDIIGNRDMAVAFLKTYMPRDLTRRINWTSVQLDSASVEHIRQQHKDNLKGHELSDLCFSFQFLDGKLGACFLHIECQTTDDATLIIRIRHYQTAYLLDFIKRNKGVKPLPLIVSIIYYANKKPFSHSIDILDYFEDRKLAQQYAFTTQFIDLATLSDEQLLSHRHIAGLDLVFKHIAKRDSDNDRVFATITQHIKDYDHFTVQTLIKYLANFSDMKTQQFCDRISQMQPTLEGDAMTVAQQWEQQGIQKGAQHKQYEIARNMLREKLDDSLIMKTTGLDKKIIISLKKESKD